MCNELCPACAIFKTPCHLPKTCKLHPPPILSKTFQNLMYSCDSPQVQRMPSIQMKNIPTAMETAEALFHHVFRNCGLPEDIVSNRGPQFISRVWKAFFQLLYVSIYLQVSTHNLKDKQNWRFRRSAAFWSHITTITNTAGVITSHGQSMHRTPFINQPPVSLHSSMYSVSNLPSFSGQESLQKSQLWTTGLRRVIGSGTSSTESGQEA